MCVIICMCMYVCIHVHVRTITRICMYTYTHICVLVRILAFSISFRAGKRLSTLFSMNLPLQNRCKAGNWPSIVLKTPVCIMCLFNGILACLATHSVTDESWSIICSFFTFFTSKKKNAKFQYWRMQNNCSSSDCFITVQCRIFALSVLFL